MPDTEEDERSLIKLAQLRYCVSHGSEAAFIEQILRKEGEINYSVSHSSKYGGFTALHFAEEDGWDVDLLRLLLKYGADFTIKNDVDETVLHQIVRKLKDKYSATWGLKETFTDERVKAMLCAHVKKLMPINPGNAHGLTHFHIACAANHPTAVKMFLDNGVPIDQPVDEKSPIFPSCTPLLIAVKSCAFEAVQVLVQYGANLQAKDEGGATALHWLIECNRKVVDYAAMEKEDVSPEVWLSKLAINKNMIDLFFQAIIKNGSNLIDKEGLFYFHIACTTGDASVVKKLLPLVEQIDLRVNEVSHLWPGYTPLHFAAYFDFETVKLLLSKGADITARNANGLTPLDICIGRYSIEDIHFVVSTRASWRSITLVDGETKLLDVISATQNLDRFALYLDEHVKRIDTPVSAQSPLWPGFTPLHLSVLFSEQTKIRADFTATTAEYSTSIRSKKDPPTLALVEECLRRGADVTAADAHGCTPLHLAFRHQRTRAMKALLEFHDSSANPIDEYNVSHLHIACAMGNKIVVQKFLAAGADVHLQVHKEFKFRRRVGGIVKARRVHAGSTPLHVAVACDRFEVAKVLVAGGADVNATDDNGATPIHAFLVRTRSKKRVDACKTLLSANAAQVIVDGCGITHLHVASYVGDVHAVERLLDLGAHVDARLGSQAELDDFHERYASHDVDEFESNRSERYANATALQIAVWNERKNVVKVLLDRGADLLAENAYGESPLFSIIHNSWSVYSGVSEVVRGALDDNAALARRVEEEYGLTALHLAFCEVKPAVVRKVIRAGASVNARLKRRAGSLEGFTPLHVLVKFSWNDDELDEDTEEIVKLLKAAGADVTLPNAKGETPLHMIGIPLQWIGVDLLRPLIRAITDFNCNPVDDKGVSHFLIACLLNDAEVIEQFLKHGVDVNATTDFLHPDVPLSSPLHLVAGKSFECDIQLNDRAIDVLLENGADLNAQDAAGETLLHLIARRSPARVDICRKLFRAGADLTKMNRHLDTPFTTLLKSEQPSPELIDLFVENGCFVNEFNVVDQQGCLSHSLRNSLITPQRRAAIFEALFKSRDVTKTDVSGRTALHNIVSIAAVTVSVEEYSQLTSRLCNKGCDINSRDQTGRTALHVAMRFRNVKAVMALLTNDADINIVDSFNNRAFGNSGGTAIHNIVSTADETVSVEEYSRLISRLCNKGCDIDAQDQTGRTALHMAARFMNVKAILALLMNGADINVVDSINNTAFSYGLGLCECEGRKKHQHPDVIKALHEHVRQLDYLTLDIHYINRNLMAVANRVPVFRVDEMETFYGSIDFFKTSDLIDCNSFKLVDGFEAIRAVGSLNMFNFLSETGIVAVYPLKATLRLVVDAFSETMVDNLKDRSAVFGLFQLQIRKARKRITLMDPGRKAFDKLIGFVFPDTCSRIVLRCLSNTDLKNLINI